MPDAPVTGSPWVDGIFTASALALLAWGWWKRVRPWWKGLKRDLIGGRDALLGREAVTDSITGKELAPAQPGVGVRIANVESAIVTLAQLHVDINDLKASRDEHGQRITKLEDAAVERVVGRAESAAAFQAIEAAIKATPDVEAEAEG